MLQPLRRNSWRVGKCCWQKVSCTSSSGASSPTMPPSAIAGARPSPTPAGQQQASGKQIDATASQQGSTKQGRSGGGLLGWTRGGKEKANGRQEEEGEESFAPGNAGSSSSSSGGQQLPETFPEMVQFNCKLMGYNISWINLAMEKLDALISCVAQGQDAYLELEANFLAMRIHKEVTGKLVLKEFRVVLLSSLRSLIGDVWSGMHEQSWSRMWSMVEEKLEPSLALPAMYERAVANLTSEMAPEDKRKIGMEAFKQLFRKLPDTEKYFKQNNERLCFFVTRAIEMSGEIYQDPVRLINDTLSLGLRHIMYQVNTQYFEPFVFCMLEEGPERSSSASPQTPRPSTASLGP
mmetsp:Transcript_127272/g.407038  ORF Transcript_127272/g.407038 Transcript_127272/m.407038 type:complete len:350 (+) Transcript_127272:354-1403(+)